MLSLLLSRSFLLITFVGNLLIVGMSLVFYWIEYGINQSLQTPFDAIWWGFCTATTVGYGDIVPVTIAGKLVGILLMLAGLALFATFTALFAQTVLEDEFFRLKNKSTPPTAQLDFLEQLKRHRQYIDEQINIYEKQKEKSTTL